MITKENYELYFIDFLEGKLSKEEMDCMDIFLEENPELKAELKLFENTLILSNKENQGTDLSFLKKTTLINSTNEDDFIIGFIEGDLSKDEEKELAVYLAYNRDSQKKFESYKQTILVPELTVYPGKNTLKKKERKPIILLFAPLAAAAAILFFVWINIQKNTEIRQIAEINSEWNLELPVGESGINNSQINKVNTPFVKSTSGNLLVANIDMPINNPIISREKKDLIAIQQNNRIVLVGNRTEINSEPYFYKKAKNPVSEIPKKYSVSPREFVTLKSQEYAKEKTGTEIKNSADLITFASKKAKDNLLPKFIKVETKEFDNQMYRTIKIGKKFSIKRKIKN